VYNDDYGFWEEARNAQKDADKYHDALEVAQKEIERLQTRIQQLEEQKGDDSNG
jgi:phage-related tail protein